MDGRELTPENDSQLEGSSESVEMRELDEATFDAETILEGGEGFAQAEAIETTLSDLAADIELTEPPRGGWPSEAGPGGGPRPHLLDIEIDPLEEGPGMTGTQTGEGEDLELSEVGLVRLYDAAVEAAKNDPAKSGDAGTEPDSGAEEKAAMAEWQAHLEQEGKQQEQGGEGQSELIESTIADLASTLSVEKQVAGDVAAEDDWETPVAMESLSEDPKRLDVQLPEQMEDGLVEQNDFSADYEDLLPEAGGIIGADGKRVDEQDDGLGRLGDVGFGRKGGQQGIESDVNEFDDLPGTDSPFIPGKGPDAGSEMKGGDKVGIFTKDEVKILEMIQDGDEGAIADHEKGMQQRAMEIYDMDQAAKKDGYDPETGKKKGGTSKSTTGEEGGSDRQMTPVRLEDRDRSSDADYISITTADGGDDGGTDGHLTEAGRASMEQIKQDTPKFVQPTMRDGAELVTDPDQEQDKGGDGKPGEGLQKL